MSNLSRYIVRTGEQHRYECPVAAADRGHWFSVLRPVCDCVSLSALDRMAKIHEDNERAAANLKPGEFKSLGGSPKDAKVLEKATQDYRRIKAERDQLLKAARSAIGEPGQTLDASQFAQRICALAEVVVRIEKGE